MMIVLLTLLLLAVIAWLFLTGLNEKRWVDAHAHDPSVAEDEGLLPNLTSLTGSGSMEKAKSNINHANQRLADTAHKLQDKGRHVGEQIGHKIDDARHSDAAAKIRARSKDIGSNVLGQGKELGSKVLDNTSDFREKVRKNSSEIGSKVLEKGSELGSKAIEKGSELGTKAVEKGSELSDKIRHKDN